MTLAMARNRVKRIGSTGCLLVGLALATPAFAAQSPFQNTDPIMQVPVMQMSLARLPKWTQVESRHNSQVQQGSAVWQQAVAELNGLNESDLLSAVNTFVNQARYVSDDRNYGTADHWATFTDLFQRGGDCEDYAIAKYLLLRALGIPSSRMRILVMRASGGIAEHSVLIVQSGNQTVVLDNLRARPYRYTQRTASAVSYAFNEQAMWLSMANVAFR
jgi:predicted transglutaminase-like cysteine proteinase